MKSRLFKLIDALGSSFWFVPALMVFAAVLAAWGMLQLDELIASKWLERQAWAYAGSAEGASTILGTIAGSMITITGLVYSLTLVALSLASSQFGPRLLRNFMRDRVNQAVIGSFTATFLYCLLVLRSIRRSEADPFVPHLSVTLGVMLALASVLLLIYFIHHVSISIQANELIGRLAEELDQSIDHLYPTEARESGDAVVASDSVPGDKTWRGEAGFAPIASTTDGYLQHRELDDLLTLAVERNVVIRIPHKPGRYLVRGAMLALASPVERVDQSLEEAVNLAITTGVQRNPAQDIEFIINQLVEIAVRAMSPGINDPFTAMACVDRLSSALAKLARRDIPSARVRAVDGVVRVIVRSVTFPELVSATFDQIRQSAKSSIAVSIRLLEAISAIGPFVRDRAALDALKDQADRVRDGFLRDGCATADLDDIDRAGACLALLEPRVEQRLPVSQGAIMPFTNPEVAAASRADPQSHPDPQAGDHPVADWEDEGGSPPDVISSTDSDQPEVAPTDGDSPGPRDAGTDNRQPGESIRRSLAPKK